MITKNKKIIIILLIISISLPNIIGKQLNEFHSYSELTLELQQISTNYPNITYLQDIGKTVQNRTIWSLKITDNPKKEENEPELRICGAHHGDEKMSYELPLKLAWYLVEKYDKDPYITYLINNREINIIPMVNPDGVELNTRNNANKVDLNRDYGYMWDGSGGSSSPFSQPETQAIRNQALENNFVLSLSYHTTASYVNYLWNYKPQLTPDDDIIVFLSYQYATSSGYTAINGHKWYQVRGDTNDFSYGCRGDIDWTIETENTNIPNTWNKNRDAMLNIIDAADIGLKGVVTDKNTNKPVTATIWIEEAYWPCFTDSKIGDYHKVIFPGNYTIHFRANGYNEQTYNIEVIDSDESTIINTALSRGDYYYAYQVTWCNFYDPYNYPYNFQNNPTEAIYALGPPDNKFASLGVGGIIVLDVGEKGKGEIFNNEGYDFIVFEGDARQDGYQVYASENWNGPWISIGNGIGTTYFDLKDGNLEYARYIKIQDDNDGNVYEKNPGFDLDAIQVLNPSSNPPFPPSINGISNGKAGREYEYIFVTSDPNDDMVTYQINWGDKTNIEKIGPYPSNIPINLKHTWEQGNFTIEAKAIDTYDAESEITKLEVIMPKSKTINHGLLYRFKEKHPYIYLLINNLLENLYIDQ